MFSCQSFFIRHSLKWIVLTIAAVVTISCATNGNGPNLPPPGDPNTPPPIITPPPLTQCEATQIAPRRDVLEPFTPRIVGRSEATPNAWPWATALTIRRQNGSLFPFCGGSLIAPDWVLTAAHCRVEPDHVVVIGRHDLRTNEGEEHAIEFVLFHNQYNTSTSNHDIALIKLATPSQQPTVALVDAFDTHSQPGDDSTVIGWGRLSEGGQASPTLQEVTIPIVSNQICDDVYTNLTSNMICAGVDRGGLDSCQGDSGGPLMVQESPQSAWQQAGVVSFGIGCARQNILGVYTRVSQYVDWVAACQANSAP